MVELTALLRGTFLKFKLQAEVAVLDHESHKRQRTFGVELYDLIEKQKKDLRAEIETTIEESKSNGNGVTPEDMESVMKVFQTIENEIAPLLEACRADVEKLESNTTPLKDILIQRRKEDLGVAVWPIVTSPKWLHETLEEELRDTLAGAETKENQTASETASENNKNNNTLAGDLLNAAIKGVAKGTKTTITKAIGRLCPKQREVEACVKVAKKDVAVIKEQKIVKLSEIEELVMTGNTLECCSSA